MTMIYITLSVGGWERPTTLLLREGTGFVFSFFLNFCSLISKLVTDQQIDFQTLLILCQLDDTKKEGQEQDKKEEDQGQIPDEENGIEMSDNFDGALHDMEGGEEEDDEKSEDENEEENELDKLMGEVDGQEAEKLDEKMWGDSDDEDDQEVQLVYLLLQYNRRFSITFSVTRQIWGNKS